MKVTRRDFMAFLVGGVAGIQITPIPWKLTDDIAIWTQNWPWVPVPPTGEFKEVDSVCNLCPGGCGIKVRKVDNRAVKIEGRTDYPVNPGGICPLGMGGLQLLYDETMRFSSPMKRVGPRGTGVFMDITWEEAIQTLANRISTLRKQGRPEELAAVDGNRVGTTVSVLIERLMRAVGSPNYVRTPSLENTYSMGNALMQGIEGPIAYDLENADYVLSFGCGLLEGWGTPGRVMNAWSLWNSGNPAKKRCKIVQVESRASNSASKADYWVAPRPGTDAALALGIAHVIVKDGLFDSSFVKDHCSGFEDWRSEDGKNRMGFKSMVLNRYSPGEVASLTGLDAEDVVSMARQFAKAKAPIAIYGKGKDALNGGLYEFMAVHSLNALMGRINRPGGVLVCDPLPLSPLPYAEADAVAREGLKKPRLDQAGTMRYPFSHSLINNFTSAILEGPKSPVDTLLVFSANPAFTLPDGGAFREALEIIPFIVSFSPFRDETSFMADLVLPDCTYLEKTNDIVWPVGLQYPFYGLSKPVVKPVYNTWNTGDVILRLGKGIDDSVRLAFLWESFEEVLAERTKGLFDAGGGLVRYSESSPPWKWEQKGSAKPTEEYKSFKDMWGKIRSSCFWFRPVQAEGSWEGVFKTPSGKFEFSSSQIRLAIQDYADKAGLGTALKEMGIAGGEEVASMPHYEPLKPEADPSKYPLFMLPYEMINLASGWIPSPPFLYKTIFDHQLLKERSFAAVNPETAAKYALKEGDEVIVQSPAGKVHVRVNLFEGAMPGIVYLPLGFGHTAYDEFLQGKGANPNDIIQRGRDPLSGDAVWWNTRVEIIKV
jgi:anaerobic selenocysteine-containing dehydrogenase